MKNKEISIFKIAATYIGTIVGAGFASGQEVLQFFSAFGLKGLYALIIVTTLFFVFGYTVLIVGMKLNASSHMKVIRYSNGKILGGLIDILITVFLFGALSAMIAGAGAIFTEQFNLPSIYGTIIMALVTFSTVILGISGVISSISLVVPVLLISVFFVSIYTLFANPITVADLQTAQNVTGATPNWIISAINYASYNLLIAVPILAPMGAQAKSKNQLLLGSLFGGLGLGIGATAIYLTVLTNITTIGSLEIPMILIASKISPIIQIFYSIVLFAEVYTTAVSNLYGFTARIISFEKKQTKLVIAGVTLLAFAVSQLGFSTMVKYLYPAIGYGGMLMLLGLASIWIFRRKELNSMR